MKIDIESYPLSMKIGHFKAERAFVRDVFVSLSMTLASPQSHELENLGKTVDYGEVIEFLEENFAGKTVHLIETLLYQIAGSLLKKFHLLEKVTVSVEKTYMRPSLVKGSKVRLTEDYTRANFL